MKIKVTRIKVAIHSFGLRNNAFEAVLLLFFIRIKIENK